MTLSLNESLETRMKGYEKAAAHQFAPRNTIIVRVDGVAFHTFTKAGNQPFDLELADTMTYATSKVQESVQGCVLGYTQSDEASFLLTDLQGPKTEGWFGFKQSKLESVIASMFTFHFNDLLNRRHPKFLTNPSGETAPALFDARSFAVPAEDAPNVFVWRQKDAFKNFINLVVRSKFGHSAVQGKSQKELISMYVEGVGSHPVEDWHAHFSYGTVFSDQKWGTSALLGYSGFRHLIEG